MATPSSKPERKTRKNGQRTYVIDGQEYVSVTTFLQVLNKPALVPWAAKREREAVIEAAAQLYDVLDKTAKFKRETYIVALEQKIGGVKKYQKDLEAAGNIGTEVHNRVEWELKQRFNEKRVSEKFLLQAPVPSPLSTPEAITSFARFQAWEEKTHFLPIHLERILWSHQFGYAGTTDWIGYVDGVLTVGDWKTGKAIYPEVALQLAAYVFAAIELQLVEPPVQGCCVRLPKVKTDPEAEVRIFSWEEMQVAFEAFKCCMQLFEWAGGMKEK